MSKLVLKLTDSFALSLLVDGGLTPWSAWETCSAACGPGTKTRSRSCTNPEPQHGGKDCVGELEDEAACQIKFCPVDCKVGAWDLFGECSHECGGGSKTRTRVNVPPQHGGKACPAASETVPCNAHHCPSKMPYFYIIMYMKVDPYRYVIPLLASTFTK